MLMGRPWWRTIDVNVRRREAKVDHDNFGASAQRSRKHNVVRLEVAVDDSLGVDEGQALEQLIGNLEGVVRGDVGTMVGQNGLDLSAFGGTAEQQRGTAW